MIALNGPRAWRIGSGWLAGWVLVNAASFFIWFGIVDIVLYQLGIFTSAARLPVTTAVYTLSTGLLGVCQWLMLGRRVSGLAAWTGLTMLGFLAGDLSYQAVDTLFHLDGRVNDLVVFVIGMAFIGLGIGAGQWWLLRRSFARAGWWVAACAVGWASGIAVAFPAMGVMRQEFDMLFFTTASGLCTGLLTAACLARTWHGARTNEDAGKR